jgi:hypothetical protein
MRASTLTLDAQSAASPITDTRLSAVFDYWIGKSADRKIPRRRDIDPVDIPKLLPILMIVDVLPSHRYRYRLVGTENADAFGVNATGRYLDEVLPGVDYKKHVLALYDKCVRSHRPLYSECLFISVDHRGPEWHIKVLFLPLSEEGETVKQVLVAQVFLYMDLTMRQRHFIEARPFTEIAHILL